MSNEAGRKNEIAVLAGERFGECLTKKSLPGELSPSVFTEALLHPDHFPIVNTMLQQFGVSGKTTYSTEWNGSHLNSEKVSQLLPTYQAKMKQMVNVNVTGDKRYWALSLAHANGNEKQATALYEIMAKSVGPKLGFKTDLNPTNPGDYQLIFQYLQENIGSLRPMFMDDSLNKIDRLSAMIGLNGEKVIFDQQAASTILNKWSEIVGNINVDDTTIKKGKLDPEESKISREGSTSITREFEKVFVGERSLSDAEYGEVFGIDSPTEEIRQTFRKRIGLVQLVLLGTLKDKPVVQRQQLSGDYPIKQIGENTKINLPVALRNIQEIVTKKPGERDLNEFRKTIDPDMGNRTLSEVTNELIQKSDSKIIPGYGAANALLSAHCEAKLKGNTELAGKLEKLMLYSTRIATDPHTIEELGIDTLLWE